MEQTAVFVLLQSGSFGVAKAPKAYEDPPRFHAACKGRQTKLAGGNMPALPGRIPRRFGKNDELEPEDFRSGKTRIDR
ncbi:hypothetical protein GCM10010909_16060 [Acidocella aquatica]|uniref:Uncharacterized protein n=1 Tax=Acidocella aquatica TaxID=1922313 RepID=A0ABQ6A502_9PROT|nr:hypothetical protein [Acidocella aquatica]GLR66926.1 hypothetical protein GCM10010909_16060 [Acidocella aquatica]